MRWTPTHNRLKLALVKLRKQDGGSKPLLGTMKKKNNYIRCAEYSLEEVFHLVKNNVPDAIFEGTPGRVNLTKSLRLVCFERNHACADCGIKGAYFASEKSHERDAFYHLNLYAKDACGNSILMTKDHIVPASKGGPDSQDNLQTMCFRCNTKKGNKLPEVLPGHLLKYGRRVD